MRAFSDTSLPRSDPMHIWIEQSWKPENADTPVINVPLHWHQHHDEHLQVLTGAVNIFHHGSWHVVTPETGIVVSERGDVHGFHGFPGVGFVLKESVTPAGEYKVGFFWDAFQDGQPGFLRAARLAWSSDYYPAVTKWKWMDWMLVCVVGGFTRFCKLGPDVQSNTARKR
ncbi:hypothetical protein C7974DRAFT_375341 [Boeremia exigua]|uniref:uncharacterized protein n=1 Tax=Boeremia exigua TaxID=749465 RepID=UPI001E8CA9D8|nr:uncharacterized protein C7974DRAFT_375341 [Boeremia exigua]KAH6633232.1 hypothetical protein C7974DRAFT_375341 [Boeremia exigua]